MLFLDQNPFISKYTQKKDELKDTGRSTAKVPLVMGVQKAESEAKKLYLNSDGQFVINGQLLEPETVDEDSLRDHNIEQIQANASISSTRILKMSRYISFESSKLRTSFGSSKLRISFGSSKLLVSNFEFDLLITPFSFPQILWTMRTIRLVVR